MFTAEQTSARLIQTFLSGIMFLFSTQTISAHASRTSLYHRKSSSTKITGLTNYDGGFWFANMTIGGSNNTAELLIDTGSADLALNPGLYVPSSESKDLKRTLAVTYGTTTEGSSGSTSDTITGSLYNDTVTFQSLILHNQTIGVLPNANNTGANVYPHDGIVGLGAPAFSGSNSTPYFDNLCDQNLVEECRFGLALNINGTGILTLGGLDTDRLPSGEASLIKVPIVEEWFAFGDAAVAGKIVAKDALLEFDSGTSGIIGPISAISAIFNQSGIQSVLQYSSSGNTLVGCYACNSPPTIGFSLPSQSNLTSSAVASVPNISNSTTIFNIETSAMIQDQSDNNFTAAISGFDFDVAGLWVIGEAFFQGKYVDHNLADGSLGFALLENNASSISTSNSSSPAFKTSATPRLSPGTSLMSLLVAIGTTWMLQ